MDIRALLAACNHDCREWWNIFGTWFAGLATFAAVILSLILSRKDRIALRVSAGHRMVIATSGPEPELVVINVRNVGLRPAIVQSVGWRRWPFRRAHAYQMFDPARGYGGPPRSVEAGDSISFCLPINEEPGYWAARFMRFIGRPMWLGTFFLEVHVYTPAGQKFKARVEPSLRKWFREHEKELRLKARQLESKVHQTSPQE